MQATILARIFDMFDAPIIQNNLRGLYVEVMVAELLGDNWKHTGTDWAGWDLENESGCRIEVKQSAKDQTWGPARSAARYNVSMARGHYPDGITYLENAADTRLADIYIFAWHEGSDQRDPAQWQFFVVASRDLPAGQSTIGLTALRRYSHPVSSDNLKEAVGARVLC